MRLHELLKLSTKFRVHTECTENIKMSNNAKEYAAWNSQNILMSFQCYDKFKGHAAKSRKGHASEKDLAYLEL